MKENYILQFCSQAWLNKFPYKMTDIQLKIAEGFLKYLTDSHKDLNNPG